METLLLISGIYLIANYLIGKSSEQLASSVTVQTRGNMDKLESVHPKLKAKVLQLVALAAQEKFTLTVTSGERTFAEQTKLFNQGRTTPGQVVTKARAGQSYHNYKVAADLAFVDANGKISFDEKKFNYHLIGKWANQVGLDWGGNFKTFKDKPHVQLRGVTIAQLQTLYKKGGMSAILKSF